ncbi:HTH domain-containing protein [Cetobacterium sp. 8H]|uniref:helix-turn-helix domain-containing protein n=1 Tax=Cetobacterium sp. 8H TaxID=2759681 RepID=UPI00163BAAB5|nr:HTH domain-containing protein [Cetobacterium sp. 8H]MBC2851608.1 HTH domain-containing protein [Cetobacterium sp. 8H]
MNVTSIHFKIMYCLKRNVYSVSELADILNISEFKTKRYLKDLEYLFDGDSIENIHNKISKTPKIIDKLRKKQSFTPEERRMYIILKLLKLDIINLSQISEKIGVTRRTLTNDLNELKEILEKFSLEIKNLTRYGIILEGKESDKRDFFKLYLIKIFLEQKYLPEIFDEFFIEFYKLKETYKVYSLIKNIFKLTNLPNNTFVSLNIESITYISILRTEFQDSSTDKKLDEDTENKWIELVDFLKKTSLYSDFDIYLLIEFSMKKFKTNLLKMYPKKAIEAINLIKYIEDKLRVEIKITKELLNRILLITIVMDYKQSFNINEFYIFNNSIGEAYLVPYKKIADLLKKYFGQLDSFDLANLTMTLLNVVYLDIKKEIDQLKEIAVVYKFLHKNLIIDLCEDVGLKSDVNSYHLVSAFDLEAFLKENNPKVILTFEDLDFSKYHINDRLVEFNFPITKYDKLKLKPFIEKII